MKIGVLGNMETKILAQKGSLFGGIVVFFSIIILKPKVFLFETL